MREINNCCANFSFGDRSVALSTCDASVISKLSVLLDLPVAEYGEADFSISLREAKDGFSVQTPLGIKQHEALPGAIVYLAQVISFMLLPFKAGYVLHAAAFIANGKAQLFLGPGHVGKSTLMLEAWLMGYEVLGDDYLLLDLPTAALQAVPKPLKIRLADGAMPERLAESLSPDNYCLGHTEESWVLLLSRGLPRMAPLSRNYPIGNIYLLERTDENTGVCPVVDKNRFLRAIYDQLASAPRNNLDILRCLSQFFSDSRVFLLRVGPGESASAIAAVAAMP